MLYYIQVNLFILTNILFKMTKRVSQKYLDGETSTPAKRGRPSTKEAIKETVKKAAKRYITSDEESSGASAPPPPKKKSKPPKQVISDDEVPHKKKKVNNMKQEAVMVIYEVDDTMPELKQSYNDKSGSLLLSDLFELNPRIKKTDVKYSFIIIC